MQKEDRKSLYLPRKDRSFWQAEEGKELALLYLAWGRRDFAQEYLPPCMHEGWVCVLIEEGRPEMLVRGERIQLRRGSLVLIGPDCPFGWLSVEGNCCKFLLWMWSDMKLGAPNEPKPADFRVSNLSKSDCEPFFRNHQQCRSEAVASDGMSGKYFLGCKQIFEVILKRNLESASTADSDERFKLATEWVSRHLDSRKPVARLCDYLSVSQSRLHRLFKDQAKASPSAYIHKLKMDRARSMLMNGEFLVKEVAHQLGYSQFNDFSRAYRSYFGRRPSDDCGSP
jgi:AraC-like DNA-binding protein